ITPPATRGSLLLLVSGVPYLGLLSSQLDRGRVRRHRSMLEGDVSVLDVHDDRLARLELLPQELLRQRVLDQTLEGSTQRPGPEGGVVALLGEQVLGIVGE